MKKTNYSKKLFTGTITALVTPFKKNGELDLNALENLVEFQIKEGIDGIVPCGSTGEFATLTTDEYELVIKTVVKIARKRVPIIAGAGSNDTEKAIMFSKIAQKAGVKGLLHVTPFYNKPTPAGLLAHFKAIAKAVDLPIILYNVPGRTGANVTAATQLMIASKVPQVVATKEASGNIFQMAEIIQGAPSNFSVLSGEDSLTFPFMALGGDGIISVISNEIPRQFSDMTNACIKGNWDKGRRLHYEWLDLMNINFIETNPQPVKTALAIMGKIQESFRLPLVSMEEKNKQILKDILKNHKLI